MKAKNLKFIAYNIIVTFSFFVFMEVGIEIMMSNSKYIPASLLPLARKYYMTFDRSIIQFREECAIYDSTLYYTLRPGNFSYSNREFTTNFDVNELGLRDDKRSLDSPSIIVLGDSYAMGWGVDQDSTFANILEEKLPYKVLNAGVSSYGTAREMQLLQKINTDSLQFLIIQYCSNDYRENKSFINNHFQLKISSKESYLTRCKSHQKDVSYYPFKHIVSICKIKGKELKKKQQVNKKDLPKKTKMMEESATFLKVLTHSIDRIPAYTKVIIFSADDEDGGFINAVKKQLEMESYSAYQKRISLLDLSPSLDKSAHFILDDHINAYGHRIIANKLENCIHSNS